MKTVVYFNQWFSSIGNIMDDLKSKFDIEIIASSKNNDHVYKLSANKFILETWDEGETTDETLKNYTDFLLDICRTNNVNIFFVKKNAEAVMKRAKEFKNIGVILISDDYNTLSNMNKKSEVYDKLSNTEYKRFIPEYYVFDKATHAYRLLYDNFGKNNLCLKLDKDEGGASFRKITDKMQTFNSLSSFRINTLTTTEALELIMSKPCDIGRLLFMEILDSPEISVDCYNSKNGFISICRSKESGRKQRIYYDKEISKICEEIGKQLGLKFPFNVQFRVKHGEDSAKIENLRLLEVNPRMSGGLYYEVLCGLNIAEICLLDSLNRQDEYSIEKFRDFDDKYVTHIEKAVIIK